MPSPPPTVLDLSVFLLIHPLDAFFFVDLLSDASEEMEKVETPPTFCLVAICKVESKELKLKQKKCATHIHTYIHVHTHRQ